ncbi:hypothetical protein [Nocardia blacklockiae]|uniref:hypothetical protein n=1 Tax=Nocardia blacklockiae TaxID=480036 RepID=UPI001E472C41|nr:hypothetical protein [Nocardia blacklockiae]
MIVIIGLVILIAAVLVGVIGVFANSGNNHTLTDHFGVLGYHVTGSTGVLFLYGIVVGGLGLAGLGLLLAGARRTARRGRSARRELKASRHTRRAHPSQPPGARPDTAIHTGTGAVDAAVETPGAEPGSSRPLRLRGLGQMFARTTTGAR